MITGDARQSLRATAALGLLLAAAPARASLELEVLLVNDPDFPSVTTEQAHAILEQAGTTVRAKLGYDALSFHIVGNTSVTELFASAPAPACLAELERYRARPGVSLELPIDVVQKFLQRWKLEELRAFFPEERRAALATYEQLAAALSVEHQRKLELLATFELAGGRTLLDPAQLDQRSYVRWICAMREQNRADLILTNAFILYDLASEPYPHSIFAKSKVGGASLASSKRKAIRGRAVVASTFSMVTELPFFREEGAAELSASEKARVIGTFIVAHELGHAVFKLPDFYDHPKQCLMTTKYETGYVSGWRDLEAFPGPCAACQPYVEARGQVFRADGARTRGDTEEAIRLLKEAIRSTPKHIDGNYLRYIASLSVEVSQLYLDAGATDQARRWVKSALRVAPDLPEALALEKRLEALSPPSPAQ